MYLYNILSLLGVANFFINSLIQTTTPQITVNSPANYDQQPLTFDKRRPIVIWHGLGDNYNSSGITGAGAIFNQVHPNVFVHYIYLDIDPSKDQQLSMFGDANAEVQAACEQIAAIPELKKGFDAVGFSQGGLLLRALAETCHEAKIHNLVTFGSPHLGVQELPLCRDPGDWVCRGRNALLKKQVWFDSVQKHIIPAQYFRDPKQLGQYLDYSHFLADINNERNFNATYRKNFVKINKFVMIQFTEDTTLVPKESAWFTEIDSETGDVVPVANTRIFQEDLIGLRTLFFEGKLIFDKLPGDHMEIPETYLVDIAMKYLGSKF